MISDEEVKAVILLKLYKRGKWGGSHTAFDNLKKGFKPKELGKQGLKRVDKMGRHPVREGLLLTKPTRYGLQVSLNPRQHREIKSMLSRFFPDYA